MRQLKAQFSATGQHCYEVAAVVSTRNNRFSRLPVTPVVRPLYHPAIEEITLQGILHALADPVRVSILMGLLNADTSRNCNTFVNVKDTPLPKSTLSKHFAILREAGLIRSERKGIELQNRVRLQELVPRFGALLEAIALVYQQEQEASQVSK